MNNISNKFIICCFSDEIFNGYKVILELEQVISETGEVKEDNLDVIVNKAKNNLLNMLKQHNLEALVEILNKKKFHIHSSIEYILSHTDSFVYICSHV